MKNESKKGHRVVTILACYPSQPTLGHKEDAFPLESAIPFGKRDLYQIERIMLSSLKIVPDKSH